MNSEGYTYLPISYVTRFAFFLWQRYIRNQHQQTIELLFTQCVE